MEAKTQAGLYLAIIGTDGSGKTTQARMLVERIGQERPDRKAVYVREPGMSEVGEKIRDLLLNMGYVSSAILPETAVLLFAAARAQDLRTVVTPLLEAGRIVISDRNKDDSLANQGFGDRLGITAVLRANELAVGEMLPNRTIFVDVSLETSRARLVGKKLDAIESKGPDYQARVHEGYREIAETFGYPIVDGEQPIERVHELIWGIVRADITSLAAL